MTNSDSVELRKGLWATHELLNKGVAYYMEWLILLRQDTIKMPEGVIKPKEAIQSELLQRVKAQQLLNNHQDKAEEESEVLAVLRQLYELIVPSSVGGTGDAQMLARKFLSPLVDPNSEGGKGTSKAGRKPRWKILKEQGDPRWEEEYEKDCARKEADETSKVLFKLEELGLKPLFPLFTDTRKDINWLPKANRQFVRNWDRDMFQQAVERLLSWESWNRRVADAKSKLEEKATEYYDKYLSSVTETVQKLKRYERERAVELEQTTGNKSDSYRISIRSVRGWDRIYPLWLKRSVNATPTELRDILKSVQREMSEGFGDPQLFIYLAQPENRDIWYGSNEKARILNHYAIYNGILTKLEQAKEQATFTMPDPIDHPLWVRFDARGGNLYTYILEEDEGWRVQFERLLWPNERGWEEREKVNVKVAPSKQLVRKAKNGYQKIIELVNNPKGKQEVIYRDYSTMLPFDGVLGGAKIQLNRYYLEKSKEKIARGQIGPVYLNISLEVTPIQEVKNGRLQTPLGKALTIVKSDWPKIVDFKSEQLQQMLTEQNSNKGDLKGVRSLAEGLRVMTIDLGQRASAAVSIFEVTAERPSDEKTKLFFAIPDTPLYAVHRRSLLLNLPGESPDKETEQRRKDRYSSYRAIRFQVRMLAQILKLHTKETSEERLTELQSFLKAVTEYELWDDEIKSLWKQELNKLRKSVNQSNEEWVQEIVLTHRSLESRVAKNISNWRKSLSNKRGGFLANSRYKIAGLSLWNVDDLTRNRRLLLSWSKRSRIPGKMNHLQHEERFGLHQLVHLQNVKNDRLKQLANLIVMTALGYTYDQERKVWLETYPACQVILFEDLSRYRFKLDRPRRENSQLMKWAHRSIPKTVAMQGEIYGLQVGDVYAAFSSRFHARTGTPGIRCKQLKECDLNDSFIKEALIRDKFITEEKWSSLKAGDIVPWKGGELFATLEKNASDKNGSKLLLIHADINAAQNLQRRFWNHRSELFRIACRRTKINDGEVYVPTSQSERWKKQMGKGYFVKDNNYSGRDNELEKVEAYEWNNMERIRQEVVSIDETIELEDMEEINQAIEEELESKGDYVTLFRDPSGVIFPDYLWIPQVQFWSVVKNKIQKELHKRIFGN